MRVEGFGGGLPSEGLSGPGVECVGDGLDLLARPSWVVGPGSDLSEELVVGVGPAALDCRVAPRCPPGPSVRRSSLIMVRQRWSARRLFRHRAASRGVFPSSILLL